MTPTAALGIMTAAQPPVSRVEDLWGAPPSLLPLLEKALAEEFLTEPELVRLHTEADLQTLGRLALTLRNRKADPERVSFVVDRNINYTNVCVTGCGFCNFYRRVGDSDAYVLADEVIEEKIRELVAAGGTQVLLQGGLNPQLPLEYYLDLVKRLRLAFPTVTLHAFSPPEIDFIAQRSKMSYAQVIGALKEAGLDSIPGGGAEILDDEVRGRISPRKLNADGWIEVMRQAHRLGLNTSATMMWGDYCGPGAIARHLVRIRDLQKETGGFTAFIPWTFQAEGTEIEKLYPQKRVTAFEYLKVLALSRIALPNIPNVQVSWVTQGPKVAQVALGFGGNDFGGTMMEENVVSAAGSTHRRLDTQAVVECIRDAGYVPVQRNTRYETLRVFETQAA